MEYYRGGRVVRRCVSYVKGILASIVAILMSTLNIQ